jgi:hypothetical protein
MKKILFVTILSLLPMMTYAKAKTAPNRQPSSESHRACVNAALDGIFNSQVSELKLNAQQRAQFAVEWYGSMINNDPEYKKIEDQLKLICTKAFIMAVPIQEN